MSADREPSTEALSAEEEAELRADLAASAQWGQHWTRLTRLLRTLDREREVRSDLARQVAAEIDTGDASVAELAYRRGLRRAAAILAGTDATPEPER